MYLVSFFLYFSLLSLPFDAVQIFCWAFEIFSFFPPPLRNRVFFSYYYVVYIGGQCSTLSRDLRPPPHLVASSSFLFTAAHSFPGAIMDLLLPSPRSRSNRRLPFLKEEDTLVMIQTLVHCVHIAYR